MNSSNIRIGEFTNRLTTSIRKKIILFSVLVFSPIFILTLLYSDYKTSSLALGPISNQALQGILLGDEISIDRANKTTLLMPRALFSEIVLRDGSCVAFAQAEEEKWNDKIKDPCHQYSGKIYYPLFKTIQDSQGETLGTMEVGFSIPWSYLIFIPLFIFVSALLIYYIVRSSAIDGINRITRVVEAFPLMIEGKASTNFEIVEIENAYTELMRLKNLELDHVKDVSLHKIAQQVSHDIRSPLSALEMISSELLQLPEDTRIITRNAINRIRDIANSLSTLNKAPRDILMNANELSEQTLPREKILLSPILDSIITEMRIQYRAHLGVEILFDHSKDSYGLFSRINVVEFKRVISNLVNNGVESLPNNRGTVQIVLDSTKDQIKISIVDTGVGIKEEFISKLGGYGATFGKEGGSGLGLYHAKEIMEQFGGKFFIESKESIGTTVVLNLPKDSPPDWFLPTLQVKPNSKILIFDDDQSIHQIWKGRLESTCNFEDRLELLHFSNPVDLRKYYGKNFYDLADAIFLMDHEILNSAETGLDLIEGLCIQKQAILVTSHYEETFIRDRCESLEVKLIPKSMSAFVPIQIT